MNNKGKAENKARKTRPGNIYANIAGWSAHYARTVIALYAVLALASLVFAATSLKVDTDPGKMIASDLPFRQAFLDYTRSFPYADNNFVVVVTATDRDLAREAARSLYQSFRAEKIFTDVFAPGLGEFFDRYGVLYLPEKEVAEITTRITGAKALVQILANAPNFEGLARMTSLLVPAVKAGRAPPALAGFFEQAGKSVISELQGQVKPLDWTKIVTGGIGREPQTWYLTVKPVLDFTSLDPAEKSLARARQIISDPEITRNGAVHISLTGEAALNAEELETVTRGAAIAGAVSFVLVSLIVWIGLPVTRLVVPVLSLLVAGFLLNAGFATLVIGSLNMISVAFAVLFIGLGVDYAVHATLRYWEERLGGRPPLEAVYAASHKTGAALALCTLTTALAFLAFAPGDFTGMAQLGIIAAGGIVIAFIASITLIPAVLVLIPLPVKTLHRHALKHHEIKKFRPVWLHIRLGTTIFTMLVAIASIVLMPDVRFDGDPVNLKDPKSPSVMAFRKLLKDQPGESYAAQLIVDNADKALDLAARMKKLPSVSDVRWVDSYLPDNQARKLAYLHSLRGIIPVSDVTPPRLTSGARKAMVEKVIANLSIMSQAPGVDPRLKKSANNLRHALLLAARSGTDARDVMASAERDLFVQLPSLLQTLAMLSITEPLTADTLDNDIVRRYVTGDGRWRLEIIPRGDVTKEAVLRRFVASIRTIAPNVTGSPVEIVGAADVVAKSMGQAVIIAFFLVLLVLVPVLRSPVSIALVLTPIILAALLLLGYTVVFRAPFNFANVIVLPLLLGLGVDSAIHYVMRAHENNAGRHVIDTTTPRAVLISALTTIGSFGTLWLSPHRGTASMGELLTVAIIITLVCTLVVLPQLIAWTIGRRPSHPT